MSCNGLPVIEKGKNFYFLTPSPILQTKFQHRFDCISANLSLFIKLQSSAECCWKDCWMAKKSAERTTEDGCRWEWKRI